jgi:large subunit ribosomal protein L17
MRHRKRTVKLNRTPAHLRATMANAVSSLIMLERLQTTQGRAREVCRLTERMITLAKRGDLHSRRQALRVLHDKEAVGHLFKDIGPRYMERKGGYTRIIKSLFRKGDGAPMAICELVDTEKPVKLKKSKKEERKQKAR